ncbi:hypothetical protein HDU96_006774 [Phlyctochytrium bullatum]|nr:hypothetical protein HDU96_006774 [Phlyctochytrium bullatum]
MFSIDPEVSLTVSALSKELKVGGLVESEYFGPVWMQYPIEHRANIMFPLTEDENVPKALLPVANRPMLFHQLQWLEDARIHDIMVVCQDGAHKKISDYVHNLYEKSNDATKIEVVKVKGEDVSGSADVLRHLANRIKTDFVLMSCDVITNVPPQRLIDVYRMQSPTVLALFYEGLKAEEASSWKKDDDALQEFVGIDPRTSRLVMVTPLDEVDDDELYVKSKILEAFPAFKVHTKIRDAHLYIFKRWVLDLITAKPKLTNVRRDVIRYLLRAQHSERFSTKEGIEKFMPTDTDAFQTARDLSSTGGGFVGAFPDPRIVCTAIIPPASSQSYHFRTNTQWSYLEGNKQMTRQLHGRLVAESAEISPRTQVGVDSMVGENTKIGERTSVKKSVIGKHCVIGKNVKIAGSVIMDHCIVEDNVKLEGSVICNTSRIQEASQLKDCMVGANFVIEKERLVTAAPPIIIQQPASSSSSSHLHMASVDDQFIEKEVPYPEGYIQKGPSLEERALKSQNAFATQHQVAQRFINSKYSKPSNKFESKKKKKILRAAGGEAWEDPTLHDWDPNDFRIFCGDLGNEVTDDILFRAFAKYKSLVKAKVIRDKKTSKTRGYGFISLKDPNDFVRALREMDGKYVGNRPIKLRKSNWDDRNVKPKDLHKTIGEKVLRKK